MKVFTRGFFHINLGDDLFLYILAKRYKHHTFHIIVNQEYNNLFEDLDNVVVHPYKKYRRGLDKYLKNIGQDYYSTVEKSCDLNVVIGGSLFQERENDFNAFERLKKMPKMNPTYILGANFGPFKTEEYRLIAKGYFDASKDVCFRDEWSSSLFSDLLNVRYAPDIVLGIDEILPETVVKKKKIFISIIDCYSKGGVTNEIANSYDDFIVQSIEFYEKEGYEIVLSSFCKMEGDEFAIERILNKLNNHIRNKISILNYYGSNWKEVVLSIKESEKVIASRFHSMILGIVFGVDILPISYSSKFNQFLENFRLEDYCIPLSELINKKPEESVYLTLKNAEKLKKESINHFEKLDEILKKDTI
ncbi:polysaccharide pyruvyl transferase family protein [Streptococcus pluranimalium]